LKWDKLVATHTKLACHAWHHPRRPAPRAWHCAKLILHHALHRSKGHVRRASGRTSMVVRHVAGCTSVASGVKCFNLRFVQPNFFTFVSKASNIPKSITFSLKSI
ncbi:hypothetical protein HAX54_006920, partial [Datura stramonium]|nr:hypothetical protein [Datura stramonium]